MTSLLGGTDMAIESVTKMVLFVTLIFVIKNGFGLGFRGPGDIL